MDIQTFWQRYHSAERSFCAVHLPQADFHNVNLSGLDFSHSHLNRACLIWADISGAIFTGVELQETVAIWLQALWTDLTEANISNADWSCANLTAATVDRANLTHTTLTGKSI